MLILIMDNYMLGMEQLGNRLVVVQHQMLTLIQRMNYLM